MHASFRSAPNASPMRGTFYPDDGSRSSGGPAIPRILFALFALAAIRALLTVGKRHAGVGSGWSRRREAIASLHRELHAAEGNATPPAA